MNISEIVKFSAAFLILISSVISVISALGMIRLPDVYTRIHAATKVQVLAVLLTLTGAFFYFWSAEAFISVRLILGIVFVFLTAPVAGHLIIRAAYRLKVKLAESSIEDELKNVLHNKDYPL